ncbi:MAG: efflux RND transporter periplasmic adaptor subunit [Candidatus Omnitrophica bacterium]|nr:efflux RND transporter periplasmic adaptor subunit [Candidatus Omnitrophota bacterium]MCM8802329.1 efflux RND transporter periplasmic adaptor subunit [Candidatus Omnitrophota bacterium]
MKYFKIFKNKLFFSFILLIILFFVFYFLNSGNKKLKDIVTYKVKRIDLPITIHESGNLVALKSTKIINQVPGRRTILDIVEEGTEITEEDVKKGKILVKLDSDDLETQRDQMLITVENSYASYLNAQENLEIVKKENDSMMKNAELKVNFAKMDLEKYLGSSLANQVIEKRNKGENVEYKELVNSEKLGGEALNKKRQLENNIDIAKEEVIRAQNQLDWSKKLAEKGYITKNELEADRLSLKQKEVSFEQAQLSFQLFINYEFPKNVEQLLSNYLEAVAELERTQSKCKSRLIQAESDLKSKRASYRLNEKRLQELETNIKNCTIVATAPGFVTYSTTTGGFRAFALGTTIQPGATVYQSQELLNLPDFNTMGVDVKVHEASIQKLSIGQIANVKVSSISNRIFKGKVVQISNMPDQSLKMLNPDVNVYIVKVELIDKDKLMRPGMSADVEILVKELKNVIAIPIVAVNFEKDVPYCEVLEGGKNIVRRNIKLGESSETMVEIKEGLKEGDIVVLSYKGPTKGAVKKEEMVEKGKIETKIPQKETKR